jgi:trehalose 6-phosphate phosphatase
MTFLPRLLTLQSALFLDFDGTLTDIAPRPDAVVIHENLPDLLRALHQRLGGALALVTGRAQDDIDPMLAPWGLTSPMAYEHGAVRRSADQTLSVAEPPPLDRVLAAAKALAERHPGLLVEHKYASVALHFRLAPELASTCIAAMTEAVGKGAELQLLHGKAVVEVKSVRVGKGLAIEAFMAEPPFAGRLPVFVGDDVTDEPGFVTVQRLGGDGIKVGSGETVAAHRIEDPTALRHWLQQSLQQL